MNMALWITKEPMWIDTSARVPAGSIIMGFRGLHVIIETPENVDPGEDWTQDALSQDVDCSIMGQIDIGGTLGQSAGNRRLSPYE